MAIENVLKDPEIPASDTIRTRKWNIREDLIISNEKGEQPPGPTVASWAPASCPLGDLGKYGDV